MSEMPPQMTIQQAAERLHHLSMRYVGALAEVGQGRVVGFLERGPGTSEMRDLIDLILLTRAEINGLSKLLCDAGIFTPEKMVKEFAEQYQWLTKAKEDQLGVEVSDVGLVFRKK